MILDPVGILEKKIVSFPWKDYKFESNQLQPNGIDLRVNNIKPLHLTFELTKYHKIVIEKEPQPCCSSDTLNFEPSPFHIYAGTAYEIEFADYVNIPQKVVGLIFGRSTFNRLGLLIRGSVYDSGFKGFARAALYPFNTGTIERGMRAAQMIFFNSESPEMYHGQYGD